MLSQAAKIMCGIILLLVPTIEFGGWFLFQLLGGILKTAGFTYFQKAMFRAGHAHAGVLVILALVGQMLVDHAHLSLPLQWSVRIGLPLAALLVSGGFFGAGFGSDPNLPGQLLVLLYVGAGVLAFSVITLGIGLLR